MTLPNKVITSFHLELGFRTWDSVLRVGPLAMPANTCRRGVRVTESVRYLKQAARYVPQTGCPILAQRSLDHWKDSSYMEKRDMKKSKKSGDTIR